jgi:hypothetical protein
MKKIYAYISLTGPALEAQSFNERLPFDLRGSVRPAFKMVQGKKAIAGYLWCSMEIDAIESPIEDELHSLVARYQKYLRPFHKKKAVKLSAHIVHQIGRSATPRGYYISRELLNLLTRAGMDLDIDVSRNV